MKNYEELFQKIIAWARERKIDQADPRVEFMKMTEELGELSGAYNKENRAKLIDSIGDLQIALLIFCKLVGVDHYQAMTSAYHEIAQRTGMTTDDGVFIKKKDLKMINDEKRKS
ncbi:DNA-binding protein [Limosilactobacillus sp. STM2_1]|uniref:DNA-binding protein n=1 Tax=Limosilactobacillus rudii TaxID=2759755 RepID=A0A7W3UJQ3_9LACO|nr:MazG-like family protein [Limosilactobacillus rudii]MBB1080259.1 DNA-binding protein [Limosilactobacillus rudii]MBB1096837.1 DNA-binding protein [Limosilactobacillus rudii]MCD7133734.1 MazG-like family protein [Limosilactobacillus rudii]